MFLISGLMCSVAFCGWLLSLSVMFSELICVVACVSTSLPLFLSDSPLSGRAACYYSWTLGCFHILAFMSKAAVNICIQGFLRVCVFISLGHTPRSAVARSYSYHVWSCDKPPDFFPKQLRHFLPHPVSEGSRLSRPRQHLLLSWRF